MKIHQQRQRRHCWLLLAFYILLAAHQPVATSFSCRPCFVARRNSLRSIAPGVDYRRKRCELLVKDSTPTRLLASPSPPDEFFNGKRTVALIAGQSLLVAAAAIAAIIVGSPNFGLGPSIDFSFTALQLGTLLALPLGLLAAALDLIEDQYPELQDVTKATQRSVLQLMGGAFKPVFALVTAIALGLAAGFGEEMLFRGVLQYELVNRIGTLGGVAVSSIIFGALHAVTPLYAVLAAIASVYFGALYLFTDNLAVPIACHAVYDIGALFYAHWTVCQLSLAERKELAAWEGPDSDKTLL